MYMELYIAINSDFFVIVVITIIKKIFKCRSNRQCIIIYYIVNPINITRRVLYGDDVST